jgi:1-acyl-sn-glycerol-3-phosphate acyltransferase
MTFYRFLRRLATPFAYGVARLEVVGKENVPPTGPFILVANHQSILDPVFVQVVCPRPVHTLTKSTQFGGAFMGWVLPRVNAIPIRRYRIDPQAVRVVLRRLSQGEGVGIYPEGERSWDASLQPFRRGTIRVLLKAGVPVIPCGVSGSYDVWPRWSKTIRRRTVRVEFGSPLRWPAMNRRQERDAMLPEAAEALRVALEALSKCHSSLRELPPLSGADPTLAGGAISSGKAGVSAAAGNPTLAGGGLSSARADASTGGPPNSAGEGLSPAEADGSAPRGGRASVSGGMTEPPLPRWLRNGETRG